MSRHLSPRFGLHATVLVLVAIVAVLLELRLGPALGALFGAWVVLAALELLVSRLPRPAPEEARELADPAPLAGAEPFAAEQEPVAPAEEPHPLAAAPFDEATVERPVDDAEPALSTVPRLHEDAEEEPV